MSQIALLRKAVYLEMPSVSDKISVTLGSIVWKIFSTVDLLLEEVGDKKNQKTPKKL